MTDSIPQPFTNLQLELLKIFSYKIDDRDLLEIKRMLGKYFADKASDLADKIWDEKQLNADEILNSHQRTPYSKKFEA